MLPTRTNSYANDYFIPLVISAARAAIGAARIARVATTAGRIARTAGSAAKTAGRVAKTTAGRVAKTTAGRVAKTSGRVAKTTARKKGLWKNLRRKADNVVDSADMLTSDVYDDYYDDESDIGTL